MSKFKTKCVTYEYVSRANETEKRDLEYERKIDDCIDSMVEDGWVPISTSHNEIYIVQDRALNAYRRTALITFGMDRELFPYGKFYQKHSDRITKPGQKIGEENENDTHS